MHKLAQEHPSIAKSLWIPKSLTLMTRENIQFLLDGAHIAFPSKWTQFFQGFGVDLYIDQTIFSFYKFSIPSVWKIF